MFKCVKDLILDCRNLEKTRRGLIIIQCMKFRESYLILLVITNF